MIYLSFSKFSVISYENHWYNLNCFKHHNHLGTWSVFMSVFANTNWKIIILWNLDFMNGRGGCAPFSAARGRQERTSSRASGAVRVRARTRSDNIKATFRARKKKLQIMAWRSRPAASQMCVRFRGWGVQHDLRPRRAEPSRAEPRVLSSAFVLCVIWLLIVGFSVSLSLSLSNEANSNPAPRERKRLNCRDSDAFDLEREQPPGTFL